MRSQHEIEGIARHLNRVLAKALTEHLEIARKDLELTQDEVARVEALVKAS